MIKATEQRFKDLEERLDAQDVKLAEIPNLVSHKYLIGIIGSAVVAIVGAMAWILSHVMGPALDEVKTLRKEQSEDARQLRNETSNSVSRIEAKTDALYKNQLENVPKPQVRAETERTLKTLPKADAGKH